MSFAVSTDLRIDLGALARSPAEGLRPHSPFLQALCLALGAHVLVILTDAGAGLDGRLYGADGYLRLVRVEALWNSGDWYGTVIERNNAPYGLAMHWTRPMDVLLLAGAAALTAVMDFRDALYWWAVAISPLLHLAAIMALIWAVIPLLGLWHRCALGAVALLQVPLLTMGLIGRADHHMLIILGFVLALGANLRLVMQAARPLLGLAAGASLGFCLWLTMEGLILLGCCLAVSGGLWVLRGGDRARRCLWQALGLAALLALALAVERPPGDWANDEYDRLSIVHLVVAVLLGAFWAAVVALERVRGAREGVGPRAVLALVGAGLWTVAMLASFPKFFGGPEVDNDPVIQTVFLDWVSELRPIVPLDAQGFRDWLVYLGASALALPFYFFVLWRGASERQWDGWLLTAVCAVAFVVLAMTMRRFAPLAGVFLAVPVALVLGEVLMMTESMRAFLPRFGLRLVAVFGLLFGPPGLALALAPSSSSATTAAKTAETAGPVLAERSCPIDRIAAWLDDPAGMGGRPRLILAHFNHGPELLYRTGHAVVASPYHRNAAGLRDAHEAFGSTGAAAARRVVERRAVDLLLICRAGPAVAHFSLVNPEAFALELAAERYPAWLAPVDLPEPLARDVLVYRVNR